MTNAGDSFFTGDILVCEDNEISSQVIHAHLTKLGFSAIITQNGKDGVEAAAGRIACGKPFDIILMDINMPVMDGLQASDRLMELGNKAPVIALTATADPDDLAEFYKHGLSSYLVKPFKTQELRSCISEYLRPVYPSIDTTVGEGLFDGDKLIYQHVSNKFLSVNRNASEELRAAIDARDMKLIHRIAHSFKSSSGMIGALRLSDAANALERSVSGKDNPDSDILHLSEVFLDELNRVLDELSSRCTDNKQFAANSAIDRLRTLAIIDKLIPLLETGNAECLNYLDDVNQIFRSISERCLLFISQLEQYNFESANETIKDIKMLITEK